jgi:hypothetical protein
VGMTCACGQAGTRLFHCCHGQAPARLPTAVLLPLLLLRGLRGLRGLLQMRWPAATGQMLGGWSIVVG